MRAVIQRVSRAEVSIEGTSVAAIGKGYLILLGIGHGDTEQTADKLLAKILKLRLFEDETGKINRALFEVEGEVLIVSQFTLYADCKRGNRPSFTQAAAPARAEALYDYFVNCATQSIADVACGTFGAMMDVHLTNQGPFTIILDTDIL